MRPFQLSTLLVLASTACISRPSTQTASPTSRSPRGDHAATEEHAQQPDEAPPVANTVVSRCVGITPDGTRAIVALTNAATACPQRWAVHLNARSFDPRLPTHVAVPNASCGCGSDEEPCDADGATTPFDGVKEALRAETYHDCETFRDDAVAGRVTASPLGRTVTLVARFDGLYIENADQPARRVVRFDDRAGARVPLRRLSAYASRRASSVFVTMFGRNERGQETFETAAITGAELGIATCMSPVEQTSPIELLGAPPTRADATGCLAMTFDGRAALLGLPAGGSGDASKNSVEVTTRWLGDGFIGRPTCLLDASECREDERSSRDAFIASRGLTACPPPADMVRVGGRFHALLAQHDRLWLGLTPRSRHWLMTFQREAADTGTRESFEAAWQHPAGGPLFVLYKSFGDSGMTFHAETIPESGFGYCLDT